jgi:hypothetical protein
MRIFLEPEYLVGLVGLVIGAGVGVALGVGRGGLQSQWDRHATLPLLLAAGGAHLALTGAVEPLRQVLFGLYGLALIGTAFFAAMGWGIWRLGGIVFPVGSIAAYFYFAIPEHQADYVGLLIKLVEVVAVVSVAVPLLRGEQRRRELAA